MILKLIALKGEYFSSNWNIFDMTIVISADAGILMDFYGVNKKFSTIITILRALRILRVVRLLRKFENVKVILQATLYIMPSILNIMTLFLLALYIFACVGINLFSGTMHGAWINDKNNFQTFPNAMYALFRFSTGDYWSNFMYEYSLIDGCEVSCFLLLYHFRPTNHWMTSRVMDSKAVAPH